MKDRNIDKKHKEWVVLKKVCK